MTSKSILRLHDEKRMLYEGSIKLRDSQGNIKDILQLPMNEVRKMRGSEYGKSKGISCKIKCSRWI